MDSDGEYWENLLAKVRWEGISLSGYYNYNYRTGSKLGEVVVRVPIEGAMQMDLELLPENLSMQAAKRVGVSVPEVYYATNEFQIHQFINGKTLDKFSGQSKPYKEIAGLLTKIWTSPTDQLLEYQSKLLETGNSKAFWDLLVKRFEGLYLEHIQTFGNLLTTLGVPENPFKAIEHWGDSLHQRGWVLSHCDLHQNNILLDYSNSLWALDWSLALVCDPAYDVASHLHKMCYTPQEEAQMLRALQSADNKVGEKEFLEDMVKWRGLEQAKSVIVDVVRCYKAFNQSQNSFSEKEKICKMLAGRLNNTERIWHHPHWSAPRLLSLLEDYKL